MNSIPLRIDTMTCRDCALWDIDAARDKAGRDEMLREFSRSTVEQSLGAAEAERLFGHSDLLRRASLC